MTVFEEMAALPCAHGGPAGRAQLRATPEDFLVQEWLGWEADGAGDHLLLKVRKRGANTLWIAKQLARLAKIDPRDVGFAGLKDRDILLVVFEIVKFELAFELIKNLVARIDVVILAAIGAAGHEGDEVRIAPNHAALTPVGAVFIDPFLQIEFL